MSHKYKKKWRNELISSDDIAQKAFQLDPSPIRLRDCGKVNWAKVRLSIPDILSIFGGETVYKGFFITQYHNLRKLSHYKVEDTHDIYIAIDQAYEQETDNKTGFLVIAVEGNRFRPKDILIWDCHTEKWISYNRSKGDFLRRHKAEMVEKFLSDNQYWAMLIDKTGVVIRPDNYEYPKYLTITTDGVNWQLYNTPGEVNELWDAWNAGIQISYNPHLHSVKFKDEEDK